MKGVLSHAAAAGRNKDHIVAVVDVRRAYFYAEHLPRTFVELPDHDDPPHPEQILRESASLFVRDETETGCKVLAT